MSKMKRILALAVCCVITLSLFVSCGLTEVDKSQEYIDKYQKPKEKPYVTLTLYIPTEVEIDDDTAGMVQDRFNRITEEKYRTRVIFKFIEKSEYEVKMAAQRSYAMENIEAQINGKDSDNPDIDPYLSAEDFQLDIFVCLDKNMMDDFVDDKAVLDLTNDLSKKYYSIFCNQNKNTIQTSIHKTIYDNAYYNLTVQELEVDDNGDPVLDANGNEQYTSKEVSTRFGVPSNFLIGEYRYTFVKRSEADKLLFLSQGTTAARVADLEAKIDAANAKIQQQGNIEASYDKDAIIFKDRPISDLKNYPEDEYYQLIQTMPQLTYSDLFEGMFSVASTCRYPERALEVISEIYTNKDAHTILQYGVEDLTYSVNEVDGRTVIVPRENAPAYSINPRYTGNICTLPECGDVVDENNTVVLSDADVSKLFGGTVFLTREYLDSIYPQNCDAAFVKQ